MHSGNGNPALATGQLSGTAFTSTAFTSDLVFGSLPPFGISVGGPFVSYTNYSQTYETIDNYQGTGRQLVRVTIPASALVGVSFVDLVVSFKPVGFDNYTGSAPHTAYPVSAAVTSPDLTNCVTAPRVDTDDINGHGVTNEFACEGTSDFYIFPKLLASFALLKSVKGDLDATFKASPAVATVSDVGGSADFRLRYLNDGGKVLIDVVVYDVLPYVGDTGISGATASSSRGSQFAVTLTGPVTASAGVTVEYSASTNPCRPDVNASPPAGCDTNCGELPPPLSEVCLRCAPFV